MKWHYILFPVLLGGCLGINTTREIEQKTRIAFTNRLEGKSTGLERRIPLNGYYSAWIISRAGTFDNRGPGDTAHFDVLFYEDGSFIYNLGAVGSFTDYPSYFSSVIQNGKNDLFYKSHSWGVYTFSADTIKGQFLTHAANLTARFTGEAWWIIENNNTLRLIAEGELGQPNDPLLPQKLSKYQFHPLTQIPPSLPWLKNDKFFWRNSADWENYKTLIKNHK